MRYTCISMLYSSSVQPDELTSEFSGLSGSRIPDVVNYCVGWSELQLA